MIRRRTFAGIAVAATAAVAIPFGQGASASAVPVSRTADIDTPMTVAFASAVHSNGNPRGNSPQSLGEGADAACDILSGAELAAASAAQDGAGSPAVTSGPGSGLLTANGIGTSTDPSVTFASSSGGF